MSTQINVNISDERLLRDSKRRTAANQQALDERTQATKEQQAAEQAAQEAEPEKRPSAALDIRLERRPSAQRAKKYEYDLAFLNNYTFRTVINSTQRIVAEPWSFTYSSFRIGNPNNLSCPADPNNAFPYSLRNEIRERATGITIRDIDNSYNEYAVTFAPTLIYTNFDYALPTRTQTQTTTTLSRWLAQISNWVNEYTTICGFPYRTTTFSGYVVSDGPPFPREHVFPEPRAVRVSLSSTPNYIYVSTLIRERRYNLSQAVGPSYIKPGLDGFDPLNTTRTVTTKDFNFFDYGYYVRLDTVRRTVETRTVLLREGFSTSQPSLIPDIPSTTFIPFDTQEQFLQNMYPADPRRSLTDVVSALDPDINVFGYDPATGAVYFHGRIFGVENKETYLYFATVTRNTPYISVFYLLKAAKAQLSTLTQAPATFTVEQNLSSNAPYPLSVFTLRQTLAAPTPGVLAPIIGVVPRLKR